MREQFASMYFAFSTFRPHEERMYFILLMEREEIGLIVKAITVILYISINLCVRIFFPRKTNDMKFGSFALLSIYQVCPITLYLKTGKLPIARWSNNIS
jgi:hypothetical protein